MIESFPAATAKPVTASLRMVDEADVYIGIFGARDGYVPPGASASITEVEYRHASGRG